MRPRLDCNLIRLMFLVLGLVVIGGCGPPLGTPPSLIPSPTSGADMVYQDDFKNPDSGWPVEVGDKFRIGYHPPDVYHVEVSAPSSLKTAFQPNLMFDDFTVETAVFVDHTAASSSGEFRYGLALRGSSDHFYAFTISPRTKKWEAFKASANGLESLAKGSDGSIQGLTTKDNLRVDANGAHFTFHIN